MEALWAFPVGARPSREQQHPARPCGDLHLLAKCQKRYLRVSEQRWCRSVTAPEPASSDSARFAGPFCY